MQDPAENKEVDMSLRERFRLEEKELENLSLRRAFPSKCTEEEEAVSKMAKEETEEEKPLKS